MAELERMLTQLGRELDYPRTPDLATRVTAALGTEEEARPAEPVTPTDTARPRASRNRLRPPAARNRLRTPGRLARLLPPAGLRRSLALALLALLLLGGAAVAAVPSVRDAVLELFGLQGATVERRERLPAVPDLRPLELGARVPLAEARERLAFDPLVPGSPGRPDAVFVRDVPGGELTLAYRPRPGLPAARTTRLGLLISEFRGDLLTEYLGKIAAGATSIERLTVDGDRAIWIEGAPHVFFYRSPEDQFAELPLRLAQNVLLVERERVLVRIEGAFGRGRALEIARSLR